MSEAITAEPAIEVGEIAYIKLTGEPVSILGPLNNGYAAFSINGVYHDFMVRRYSASRNGSAYLVDYFTKAELTATNPNDLKAFFAQAGGEDNILDVTPEEETTNFSN